MKNKRSFKPKLKLIFLLLFLTIFIAITFAKYVIKIDSIKVQTAESFYFESDVLGENEKIYNIYDWDGTYPYVITVDLKNYKDSLQINPKNINYAVSVITSDNINAVVQNQSGILTKATQQKDTVILTLTSKSEEKIQDAWITIKAENTSNNVEDSGYKKELSAKFNFTNQNQYKASLIDNRTTEQNNGYYSLEIETFNLTNSVIIKWKNNIVFDNFSNIVLKDLRVVTEGDYKKVTINLEDYKNYEFYFISTNELVLGTDIIVTQ